MLGFRRRPKIGRDSRSPIIPTTVKSIPTPSAKKSLRSALPLVNSLWEASRTIQKPPSSPTHPHLPSEKPIPLIRSHPQHRVQSDDWTGRLLGELFFFLVGLSAWLLNALFTVLGLTAPFGLNLFSGTLAFFVHVLLSRSELYLWHRWYDPRYLVGLIFCVAIDAGTTTNGLVGILAQRAPNLLGTVPHDLWDWRAIIGTLYNNAVYNAALPLPDYTTRALMLFCIALAFALGSERLLRAYYHGLRETWVERHPVTA